MVFSRIYEIYFSATLTTEKVVKCISEGFLDSCAGAYAEAGSREMKEERCQAVKTDDTDIAGSGSESPKLIDKEIEILSYNFAYPENRKSFPELKPTDLVIFGMPTYAGRLPNLMLKYLDTIEGNGAMTIPVVTFGNRDFEDSLKELTEILESKGFRTFAAGAFSCEHSFSKILGAGRPDRQDEEEIRDFAEKAFIKLKNACTGAGAQETCDSVDNFSPVRVSGKTDNGYYQPKDNKGGKIDIRKVKPITKESCNNCGLCAEICPMGAVNPDDPSEITGICIKCGACIKRCPVAAKDFVDEGYLYHKKDLEEKFGSVRAENRIFI